MRKVWIISEGSPGHISQSVGLVEALKQQLPLEVETLECRPRLSGVGRSLVRAWMGRDGRALPRWVLRSWLRVAPLPPPEARPDLIVCSGGKSVFAARSLAACTDAPLVFLGERKPYRSGWFHTVFTPSQFETGVNDVLIEMIPTPITHESADQAAQIWADRPSGRLWAMIIGGDSLSHGYTDADWQTLASGMNRLAEQHGIRWLVSTSRRTGGEAEALLRKSLAPGLLAWSIWWTQKPERRIAAFLGSAEVVFVTQDSVTMVTEAVASGKPAIALWPRKVQFPNRSFLPGYYENLERKGRLRRLPMAEFEQGIQLTGFVPRQCSASAELAGILLGRLRNSFV